MTIDKQMLYGQFLASHARRERLADLAARKALDLPWDDDVNIIQHRQGLDARHLAGVALVVAAAGLCGLGGAGLAWLLANRAAPASAAPPAPQQYKVSFWTDDGVELEVDRSRAAANER